MVFVEGDDYRRLRRPGDDPARFRSVVRPVQAVAPDSLIHEYRAQNFTSSTWTDSAQSADITPNGLTSSTLTSEPSVSGDGVDDSGFGTQLGSFGSDLATDIAVEFVIQTADSGGVLGVVFTGPNEEEFFIIEINDSSSSAPGAITFRMRADDGGGAILQRESSIRVDDGSAHHVIVNKQSNSANGIELIIDGVDETGQIVSDDLNPGRLVDFTDEIAYFAVNDRGSVITPIDADIPLIRLFDDSLSSQTQQDLFDSQPYV
jgi:hypothetical protein